MTYVAPPAELSPEQADVVMRDWLWETVDLLVRNEAYERTIVVLCNGVLVKFTALRFCPEVGQ